MQTLSVDSKSHPCPQDAFYPSIRGNSPLTSCSRWLFSQGVRPARGARIETTNITRSLQRTACLLRFRITLFHQQFRTIHGGVHRTVDQGLAFFAVW